MRSATSQFLRGVRGSRSQVAFSRRLGYRGNPVSDWENGRRYPTARQALWACQRVGIDVPAAFARFHPTQPMTADAQGFQVATWLNGLRGTRSIRDLAQQTGHSRYAMSRFLSGKAHVRLPDFFGVVDAISGRLPDLVAELVPIEMVPSLTTRYERSRAARTIAFDEPWTEAVLQVIEATQHQPATHQPPRLIAETLGVEPEVARRCLRLLSQAGLIRKRRGRYYTMGALTVDTRAGPEALARLHGHWAAVATQRAGRHHEGDNYAYNIVSVAHDDLERIRGILRAAYREIRSVVAASEPTDSVALILMQLVDWGRPGDRSVDP